MAPVSISARLSPVDTDAPLFIVDNSMPPQLQQISPRDTRGRETRGLLARYRFTSIDGRRRGRIAGQDRGGGKTLMRKRCLIAG